MPNGYSRKFTLSEIFSNRSLADVLPHIDVWQSGKQKNKKRTQERDWRYHSSTLDESLAGIVRTSANPFYSNMKLTQSTDLISVDGRMKGDIDECVDAIYTNILASKDILSFTINNVDMVKDAIAETKKRKDEPKLFLKVGSIQEIKGMDKKQISELMDDIMRNIFYRDDFAETQKKYSVDKIPIQGSYNYAKRRHDFQKKVGLI